MPTTPRKTTAKRTTTTRRTAASKKPSTSKDTPAPVVLTAEQKQGMLEAYHALKAAGAPVPAELATQVEVWVAELQATREAEEAALAEAQAAHEAQIAEANQNGTWYVRNGYPAPFNLRLERQTEGRRIQLKPRGEPGDMHPLLDEDLKDPTLRQNVLLGVIEVIPAGEAAFIIERQTTNLTRRVHSPLAVLRNELGQTYKEGSVKVEAEFNSQGVTVATVDPRINQGQVHDREIGGTRGTGGLTRVRPGEVVAQPEAPSQATSVVHSGFVPTGGNPATIQLDPNARAQIVDELARRKDLQGPGAGLGDIKVVVEPVRRT